MNLDGPLDPPAPTPIGFCAVCGDEVYVWDKAETWTGELVHPKCKGDEYER